MGKWMPILQWLPKYRRQTAAKDLLAAIIVTLMLIPQSLAYAMLAGLPPVVGLYASIAPLVLYAMFGTSRTLAVGPVAVISLMTAAALEPHYIAGSEAYIQGAMLLAALSGVILLLMAALRLGFLANFLSHPVISGFISASGVLIALSQMKHILGIDASGQNLPTLLPSLWESLPSIHWPTAAIGLGVLVFLQWVRKGLTPTLKKLGVNGSLAEGLAKIGPMVVIVGSVVLVWALGLANQGVNVVGYVPRGLPAPALPVFDKETVRLLLPAAILISLVGFVESISVAQTLAAKRRQRIHPDQELVGLGTASLASALSGGFPVTGGLSRSVVSFDAGAQTQMVGVFTAVGIAVVAFFFTSLFYYLPHAVLAATIIVAVLSIVDWRSLVATWRYSKQDFLAQIVTMVGVLGWGVEFGILIGVALSLLLFLWRTSRPHMAVVGAIPGTEHFRNIERFEVVQSEQMLSVRVDESLYFSNARYLEERVPALAFANPNIKHLVLMCSGVNHIDASALNSLTAIADRLKAAGVQLHLSEVKGPVMDRLQHSQFLHEFGGQVFVSQFQALQSLDPVSAAKVLAAQ